jgi:hypothetical protein
MTINLSIFFFGVAFLIFMFMVTMKMEEFVIVPRVHTAFHGRKILHNFSL